MEFWQIFLTGIASGLSCGLTTVLILKNDLKWMNWRITRLEKQMERKAL